ncbi:b559dde2-491a-4918-b3b9-f53d8806c60a-CDS [Sclerotinia trifoliorum]|uniref:B559dde2-491a-4918-b3b9-f53d8806c60a-CDS n=1 Tax=Sclerotinia trifoliorum TaxID=28548 RepID=A0A8H2ZR42_9HELO|nr:b559dde2-491a-4918-b3b9-f53d8806c60a-CDS [Sclerotinia trifoliorum]
MSPSISPFERMKKFGNEYHNHDISIPSKGEEPVSISTQYPYSKQPSRHSIPASSRGLHAINPPQELSDTSLPYSLVPHPSKASNLYTPQAQAPVRFPLHLSELTIDSIPGNIFNGFKNTLLFYDHPRNLKRKECSRPVFKMSIKGLERITSMLFFLCGGEEENKEEEKKKKENVLIGGAQFDKFSKDVEVQQVGIEGLQREMESGMRVLGTGMERRWEWMVPGSFDEDENFPGKDGKERAFIWKHRIPDSSLALSFTNPNLELRDKESGDLYAVIRYDAWKRKDMIGIQFRRRWEDRSGVRRV